MSPRIVAVAASLLLSSCTEPPLPQGDQQSPDKVATSNTALEFLLETEELTKQITLAKGGDNEAALRVADHYSFSEQSPEQAVPWLVMAADRDSVRAMGNLSYYYGSGMYPQTDCAQAVKWWSVALARASESDLEKYGIRDQIEEFTGDNGACNGMRPDNSLKREDQ